MSRRCTPGIVTTRSIPDLYLFSPLGAVIEARRILLLTLFLSMTRLADPQFHLRAYVLLSGSYQLYLSRTLLALFSADAYTHPTSRSASSDTEDAETDIEAALRPHLTNTCLQTDAYGAPIREEGLVKLFWELEGMDTLHLPSTPHVEGDEAEPKVRKTGKVDKPWLDEVFRRVGVVLDESVKAGVECGSFGLQLMPNAFEVSLASSGTLLSSSSLAGKRVAGSCGVQDAPSDHDLMAARLQGVTDCTDIRRRPTPILSSKSDHRLDCFWQQCSTTPRRHSTRV